jgi:hypothetical protein
LGLLTTVKPPALRERHDCHPIPFVTIDVPVAKRRRG